MINVLSFFKEVKLEAAKVFWPSLRESCGLGALVVLVASVAGLFLLLVDSLVYKVVSFVLGF